MTWMYVCLRFGVINSKWVALVWERERGKESKEEKEEKKAKRAREKDPWAWSTSSKWPPLASKDV